MSPTTARPFAGGAAVPVTGDMRTSLHQQLVHLELATAEAGELAEEMVRRAVGALVARDARLCRRVIADDDEVDRRYLDIERRAMELLATQAPVATDLRLVTVILHINLHLERIGDQAVNLAKLGMAVMELPPSDTIVSHLAEMGRLTTVMIRTAMEAFSRRELERAQRLVVMDDPVDDLNRGMCHRVVQLAPNREELEWGVRMNVAARLLERVGDNAVDIAEQVAYLVTGERREFTDASHSM